jgi:hypothetical protein
MDHREPVLIARLPKSKVGYPVPWFVWIGDDGVPDFRVVKPGAVAVAVGLQLCWICGTKFWPLEDRVFVIGPMCAVNRVSAEPPSHRVCAIYAATHCPFLARPQMRRREHGVPDECSPPPGVSIRRNPGVALVWPSRHDSWSLFEAGDGGVLFDVGEPHGVRWFAHGRPATRAEVLDSIDSGMPLLQDAATGDDDLADLQLRLAQALELVPSA